MCTIKICKHPKKKKIIKNLKVIQKVPGSSQVWAPKKTHQKYLLQTMKRKLGEIFTKIPHGENVFQKKENSYLNSRMEEEN